MAGKLSSERIARKIARRTMINKARRSRVRTFVRKVREAVSSGNGEASLAAFRTAQVEIQRAVSRGVLHANAASRKISRLSRRVKAVCV